MGGTNTDMGLVTENGNIIRRRNIPTNAYTELEPYVRDMMHEIQDMMEEQRKVDGEAIDLEGIGIGAPTAISIRVALTTLPTSPSRACSISARKSRNTSLCLWYSATTPMRRLMASMSMAVPRA